MLYIHFSPKHATPVIHLQLAEAKKMNSDILTFMCRLLKSAHIYKLRAVWLQKKPCDSSQRQHTES